MTSRAWCWTKYGDTPSPNDEKIKYAVWQCEICPETKREHWQGYTEFTSAIRRKACQKIFNDDTMHVEPRRGNRESARNYCMKKESRKPETEPTEIGTWEITQGCRSDMKEVTDAIKRGLRPFDVAEQYPSCYLRYHKGINALTLALDSKSPRWREVKCLALIGPPGCGKTKRAMSGEFGEVYNLLSTKPLWFDGYMGEPCLLIDDFDGDMDYVQLLKICDGHKMQVPIKGSSVYAKWSTVVLTSNTNPEKWFPGRDISALLRRVEVTRHEVTR